MYSRRKTFSQSEREKILASNNCICGICGERIEGAFEIDHDIALALIGSNDFKNLRPVHPSCHKIKTKADRCALKHKPKNKADFYLKGKTKPTKKKKWPSKKLFSRKFNDKP